MSVYKMKKSLTIVPAFALLIVATFVLLSLPFTVEVLAFAILCLLVASVLLIFSFVKFIITDEYISTFFCGQMLTGFKKYNQAINLYESYMQKYPNDNRFLCFVEELRNLESNP